MSMESRAEEELTQGLVDRTMMLAFEGTDVPDDVRSRLSRMPVPGFTLFPELNVVAVSQIRRLTSKLQSIGGGSLPLLIAVDQEGGQLLGLGPDSTPFAGNMAIGATGDAALAERVGRAMGRELRAAGVNVNYAPVCDVATDPTNPSLGIRAFGDDPEVVGRLAAGTASGLQAEGVAATMKHFPGKGDARVDPHHELPRLDHDRARLESVELVPFRAAMAAGARMLMVGHYALPNIVGRHDLPSSLSSALVRDMVRGELAYDGVIITDALDMRALSQGPGQVVDAIAAVRAGEDLLLCTADLGAQDRIRSALRLAEARELLDPNELALSARRVRDLRQWVGGFVQPELDVVRCAEHMALARELAERSITLVRDEAGLLPLRLRSDARIAAIMPRPRDLTPADTSASVVPGLARSLRARHPHVDEFVTGHPPTEAEVADLRARAHDYGVLIVGTIEAGREAGQAGLVDELLSTEVPTVTVALRTPYDVAAYPRATTHVCSYGILPPTLDALAAALWGEIPFRGRLPAGIPGLYPAGHGVFR
jgi:beta-N-acetylhexosaminidase